MPGKVKVIISDTQKAVRIPKGLRMLIRRSCIAVIHNHGVEEDTQVKVEFVDNDRLAELSSELSVDGSSSYIIVPDSDEKNSIGTLYLSVERAQELSQMHSNTLEQEVGACVVHGVMMLMDDIPDGSAEESKLRDKEEYIMYQLGLPTSTAYVLNNS